MSASYQPQPKNPALAAILSFLISGLGQIYNGEVVKGVVIIAVQVVNALLAMIIIGIFTGIAVWIWSIYDAYKTAEKINQEMGLTPSGSIGMTKTCPQCQANVPNDARICQYCGYEFYPAVSTAQPALTASASQAASVQPVQETEMTQSTFASTKLCPACGTKVASDAKFCINCGHQFAESLA